MGRSGFRRQTLRLADAPQKPSRMPRLRIPCLLSRHVQARDPGILRRKASSAGMSPHFLRLRRLQVPAVKNPACGRPMNGSRSCSSAGYNAGWYPPAMTGGRLRALYSHEIPVSVTKIGKRIIRGLRCRGLPAARTRSGLDRGRPSHSARDIGLRPRKGGSASNLYSGQRIVPGRSTFQLQAEPVHAVHGIGRPHQGQVGEGLREVSRHPILLH